MNVAEFSYELISEIVKRIRKQKLPDYNVLGNAGSFFQNPIISIEKYEELKEEYSTMPGTLVFPISKFLRQFL